MKARVDVECPELIKHYNNHMGGINLAVMLIALYWTTYKSRYSSRVYQILQPLLKCSTNLVKNAWLVYRRNCSRRTVKLKSFWCQLPRELQDKGRSRISVNNNCQTDDSVRYDGIGHCPRFRELYGLCKICILL